MMPQFRPVSIQPVQRNLLSANEELDFEIEQIDLQVPCKLDADNLFRVSLETSSRMESLQMLVPSVRNFSATQRIEIEVLSEGWRFPNPHALENKSNGESSSPVRQALPIEEKLAELLTPREGEKTRKQPNPNQLLLKERLLAVLQPPLENLFAGKKVELPFKPFPYQMEGIAFLMPRTGALLADEMGLGKTMQAIISIRLLLQTREIRNALLVCPKPLVPNWLNELKLWAPDLPVEVIGGDSSSRRIAWAVSKAPLKLVNYELLTRDADLILNDDVSFDLVVLDEAQRIKNEGNKTAEVTKGLNRKRSWALTGTPIENSPSDLINIFGFVQPDEIPSGTPVKALAGLTRDSILRRVKEDVMKDMPPKLIQDVHLELAPEQKQSYELAEKEGIVHLNDLGETITIQHVFELVMRLKQICNFDPRTGQSSKLEQLKADMAEIAESGRKAIIFSQWVEPLEILASHLEEFGPLLYHGKVPHAERGNVLDSFRNDKRKHLILMSYGTGSVGLNLQFANYVFLFDRWWNPAVEDQAINRAHRIGQKSTVFVKRFISENTIEGRICEVLEHKRKIFAELIEQNGPPPRLGMNEEEIFGLFSLKPNRAKR